MSLRTPAEFSAQLLRLMAVTRRSDATQEAVRWAKHLTRGRAWELDLDLLDAAFELGCEPLAATPGALSEALVKLLMEGGVAEDQIPSQPGIPGLDVIELPGLEWLDPPLEPAALSVPGGVEK